MLIEVSPPHSDFLINYKSTYKLQATTKDKYSVQPSVDACD